MSLAAGAVVAGRYTIVNKLGEGGMGAVYRAVQEPLGREVALKVIAPGLAVDADAVARFHREAKASSSLTHPNIVTIYDFGTDTSASGAGTLFLAMELLSGQGLDALVAKGPTTPARAITILRGICAALAEAHGKGIVHRDLKPQNVMLTSTSTQQDIAKVVDFGIAKMKDGGKTLTMTGAVVGTPGYVAPELFDGKEPSPQSDLYALGVVAYELLCGQAPFPGKTPMELIKAALFTDPLPMRAFLRDVPTSLEQLVRDLLHKDPAQRPPSARAVDDRLAALQHGNHPTSQSHADLAPDQATDMNVEKVEDPTQAKSSSSSSSSSSSLSAPSSSSSSSNALAPANEARHLVDKLPTGPQIALTPPKKEPQPWGLGKVLLVGCGAFLFLVACAFVVVVIAAVVSADHEHGDEHDFDEHASSPTDADADAALAALAVAALPASGAPDAGPDFAKIQELMQQIEAQQQQQPAPTEAPPPPLPPPPGPQTEVTSPETLQKLLGTHVFTLQWVDYDGYGKATITNDNGLLHIDARQDGRGEYRGNWATIKGTIVKVEADRFVVDGAATSSIDHIAGGRPCAHKGKALVFRATGGRQYWRLSQMDSPCDGVTDYYDVFFALVPPKK